MPCDTIYLCIICTEYVLNCRTKYKLPYLKKIRNMKVKFDFKRKLRPTRSTNTSKVSTDRVRKFREKIKQELYKEKKSGTTKSTGRM